MTVLVTGGTGFVGSHVARQLVAAGESVRVLVRPGGDRRALDGVAVEFRQGDLRDAQSVRAAMAGCDCVFHVAADYRLWARDPSEIYSSNVDGTVALMRTAGELGVRRIVYTSTVGCLGIPEDGQPGDEETPVALEDMVGHYKRSKFLAEREVMRFAAGGLPVVVVNPSTPVGPGDWKPTPTGKIVLDFLNGQLPAFVETGLNLVAVEDVAAGHLLAAEKLRPGERCILGCRNVSLREILGMLAAISGRPAPGLRIPYGIALAAGYVDHARIRLFGGEPAVPLEGVRMAGKSMYFSSAKAVRVLGMPQSSVEEALARAVSWYRSNGRVRAA